MLPTRLRCKVSVFQDCPEYCGLRRKYWPYEVNLKYTLLNVKTEINSKTTFGFIVEAKSAYQDENARKKVSLDGVKCLGFAKTDDTY